MQILPVISEKEIEKLAPISCDLFLHEGLVIFPTETFYGMATVPLSETAVRRLVLAKGREDKKPIPLIACDRQAVEKVAKLPSLLALLAEAFWPGPLTLALQPKISFPRPITGKNSTIGIRVSSHPIAQILAQSAGGLVTATSANLAGCPPSQWVENLDPKLTEKTDLICDGGMTPGGLPSTVVALLNGQIKVLRAGPISEAQLSSVLKQPVLFEGK